MAIGDAYALWDGRTKIAIGNELSIDWCDLSKGLEFLATPNDIDCKRNVRWLANYPSHRPYIDYGRMRRASVKLGHPPDLDTRRLKSATGGFLWKQDYKAKPAVLSFDEIQSDRIARLSKSPFICIEPAIKTRASPNKRWPSKRFEEIARQLSKDIEVVQVSSPDIPDLLPGIRRANEALSFKDAITYLAASKLYIGPEGGLHHASAAVRTPAVVIFGGYIDPAITGYDNHINLTGGAKFFCGRSLPCPHCTEAMRKIRPLDVIKEARNVLEGFGESIPIGTF